MTDPDITATLSLSEASVLLGVHPSTLRRWADAGELRVTITPGGHRRFARADIEVFRADHQRLRSMPGSEQAWAQNAIARTRSAMRHAAPPWQHALSDDVRAQQRAIGQRLMGVVLRFVAATERNDDDGVLWEARQIGGEYAASARALGMPLTAALEATMFFRDALVESAVDLPDTLPLQVSTTNRLLRRINRVLNEVQIAIAAAYEPDDRR
jgi:excisionase family DNA binding protein